MRQSPFIAVTYCNRGPILCPQDKQSSWLQPYVYQPPEAGNISLSFHSWFPLFFLCMTPRDDETPNQPGRTHNAKPAAVSKVSTSSPAKRAAALCGDSELHLVPGHSLTAPCACCTLTVFSFTAEWWTREPDASWPAPSISPRYSIKVRRW